MSRRSTREVGRAKEDDDDLVGRRCGRSKIRKVERKKRYNTPKSLRCADYGNARRWTRQDMDETGWSGQFCKFLRDPREETRDDIEPVHHVQLHNFLQSSAPLHIDCMRNHQDCVDACWSRLQKAVYGKEEERKEHDYNNGDGSDALATHCDLQFYGMSWDRKFKVIAVEQPETRQSFVATYS